MLRYAWILALLVSSPVLAGDGAVAVMDIQGTGVEPDLLPTLSEILSVEINELRQFKVIAGRDIQAMLGFERQKDVVGCTDAACLAEIGGALGVERIVASHIGKVGSTYVVNIKLINIRLAETEGRVYETVRGEVDALIDTIRASVQKLFKAKKKPAATAAAPAKPEPKAEPAPPPKQAAPEPPPKKVATAPVASTPTVVAKKSGGGLGVGPIVLWGVGAAALGVGTIFGLRAKSQEDCANEMDGANHAAGSQACIEPAKTASVLASLSMGVGLATIAGGFAWWLLGGSSDDGATALAPVVTDKSIGFAWSGRF